MADDSEWVLESIAGYLGSPEWMIPVTDFMENKCSVFDDEDENKLTYTEIHQQYKELVEKLLENYMQEVGINEQQFLEACSSPFAKSKTLQTVFQPVLATDDFQIFRSLMVQKNMELQLQALRVIKERNGALPECLTDGADMMSELEQQEMRILQEVLKRSKEEYDEEVARRLQFEEEIGCTSSGSSADKNGFDSEASASAQSTSSIDNMSSKKTEKQDQLRSAENGEPSSAKTNTVSSDKRSLGKDSGERKTLPAVTAPVKGSEPPATLKEKSGRQTVESYLAEAQREAGISRPFNELSATEQEQLQERARYLRQQRDKLQALKKEQRPKQPPAEEPTAAPAPAPTPTTQGGVPKKTVRSSIANGSHPQNAAHVGQSQKEISVEEKKKLQKRKHLAEKLKEEVIKK